MGRGRRKVEENRQEEKEGVENGEGKKEGGRGQAWGEGRGREWRGEEGRRKVEDR